MKFAEAGDADTSRMLLQTLESRAKYTPLRLTTEERAKLSVLEAALTISEYTDKVDVMDYRYNKASRVIEQVDDLLSIICGLMVAAESRPKLLTQTDLSESANVYRSIFEVGRRFKIMSPEKLRTTYGKLIHMLMDAASREVISSIGFPLIDPIETVHGMLSYGEILDMLHDPALVAATQQISAGDTAREAAQQKVQAMQYLSREYAAKSNGKLNEAEIERCLLSIGDANAFLEFNRGPVARALELLHLHFSPKAPAEAQFSLAISVGREGARLSHSHSTQFAYVDQSLRLWNEIMSDFYKLWTLAEEDLLDGDSYRLRDTGQGLNRIKDGPRVSQAMRKVLQKVQASVGGGWVGSTVVHMGDQDVPNPLVFIDKYTQVPRILRPIVETVDAIDSLCADPLLLAWVCKEYKSPAHLQKTILTDFFRHGFDGSGANNFYDAGSCIDGRLTSAWNWCSHLDKKPYCLVFRLAGHNGFDGDFSR